MDERRGPLACVCPCPCMLSRLALSCSIHAYSTARRRQEGRKRAGGGRSGNRQRGNAGTRKRVPDQRSGEEEAQQRTSGAGRLPALGLCLCMLCRLALSCIIKAYNTSRRRQAGRKRAGGGRSGKRQICRNAFQIRNAVKKKHGNGRAVQAACPRRPLPVHAM
jgi:hypothetical protein